MITRQLLPVCILVIGRPVLAIGRLVLVISGLVLVIGGLALSGCGNQRQVPGNATQASNLTLSKIDPVGEASDAATLSGPSPTGDAASSSAQERAMQYAIPDPRQHVLSSGFPARDY